MYIQNATLTEKPKGWCECVDMLRDTLEPKVNHFEDAFEKKQSSCNSKSLELLKKGAEKERDQQSR